MLDIERPVAQADMRPMIVDSFAGGGGASTGIEMALGRSPDIAINHNPAALALHAANHPDTLHLSENVWQVDPLDHVAGRHVGLAWFSPDCKHFSKAKGSKPVERNIRDLAWVVVLWAQRARPDVILIENVEEFRDWGPLREEDRGGKIVLMPDPDARGRTFKAWLKELRRLGYRVEWRELRACDYGAPTIRKRLFLVARCDGQKIVWPARSHGDPKKPEDATLIRSGRLKPYRTAAEIIDWSLPCPSIFASAAEIFAEHGLRAVRPLAAATMSRVARGVDRYVLKAKRPFLVRTDMASAAARNGVGDVEQPLNTIMTAGSFAAISPSVVKFQTGSTGHAADEPLHTVTANSFRKKPGGAAPLGVIAPVLTYGQQGGGSRAIGEPHHTITASAKDQNAVIAPTLIQTGYGEREGQAPRALDVEHPLGTVVAGGVKHAVVAPTLVGCGGRAGQSRPRGGDEPAATVTAKADVCVALDEPAHTATAGVNKSMLVAPHLMTMRNASKPFNGADEPTHTVTAGGAGLTVVAPFVQKYYGTGDGARLDEPAHTVTVKDRFGHVEGELGWPPLGEAQLARARQVADFLRAHGFWDDREFVTVEIDTGPPPATSGASELKGGAGTIETFTVVDIGMRMLTPRELFSAQGFPPDYVIDLDFEGRPLPKDTQISCCGNSVSPPVAAALAAANCAHLATWVEAAE